MFLSARSDSNISPADWGINAEKEVRWGYPTEEIILTEIEQWLLGSTVEHVVAQVPFDVLLIKPER